MSVCTFLSHSLSLYSALCLCLSVCTILSHFLSSSVTVSQVLLMILIFFVLIAKLANDLDGDYFCSPEARTEKNRVGEKERKRERERATGQDTNQVVC